VQRGGGDPADAATAEAVARRLDPSQLEDPAFRTREAGEAASLAAAHPGVRTALRQFQQRFAQREPGAVIDGRDIGTVIAPDAPAKLFVTASPEVRAERRFKQLRGQGEQVTYDDILADIRRRDERDSARAASPLVQAADAALLDTTQMSISQAADAARRIVEEARARWEASRQG
jgi:cytidylate kinase